MQAKHSKILDKELFMKMLSTNFAKSFSISKLLSKELEDPDGNL